jgi:purine operon repressor
MMVYHDKDSEMRLRLLSVDVLREIKKILTYKEMSSILGIQESLLCRYVNGNTIPSEIQAREIIKKVREERLLVNFLRGQIQVYEDGFVDTHVLLNFPSLLKLAIEVYMNKYIDRRKVDKVVTPAVNGVPFATMVSLILDRPLLLVKKYKDSTHIDYLEENLKESSSVVANLYLRKDAIRKGENVLIVDDVIRTGKTISHLASLVTKGGGNVRTVFSIVKAGTHIDVPEVLDIKSIVTLQ